VGKSGVKRPLKNLGKDGMIILKWILKKIGWGILVWINLADDTGKFWAVVSTVSILLVPQKAGNFLTMWWTASFSGKTLVHGVH
jgi:hypothetical protein